MPCRSTLGVISGFFLLLVLSAAQTAHAAPPTDACSLLTPVQVNAVLGITAKPGHSVPDDTSVCDWPLASLAKMMAKHTKEIEVKILDAQTWSVIPPRECRGAGQRDRRLCRLSG